MTAGPGTSDTGSPSQDGDGVPLLGHQPFLTFSWDILAGTVRIMPMGGDAVRPSQAPDRPEQVLLRLLGPDDARSLHDRARAAHAAGESLDAQYSPSASPATACCPRTRRTSSCRWARTDASAGRPSPHHGPGLGQP